MSAALALELVCCHPVTVAKLASELKKDGIIKKEQGQILIIDEKRLRERL